MLRRRRDRKAGGQPGAIEVDRWPARFRPIVADALAARSRARELIAGVRPGPVQDRLLELSARVDEAVAAIGHIVDRAAEIERVIEGLDAERVTADYKAAKRRGDDPELVVALGERFAAVQRLLNSLSDAEARLGVLDARLGAVVARIAEVSLAAGAGLDGVGADLDVLVGELDALKAGLDAVG